MNGALKGLFHPVCRARVVSWFAFVVAIFMAHENGDKQRLAKRRHVQGMLDETDPLTLEGGLIDFHAEILRNAVLFWRCICLGNMSRLYQFGFENASFCE